MSYARSEPNDFKALAPDAYDIVSTLGQAAAKAGIDKQLLELVKLRASQINGCAFCVQFHILQGESLDISADKLNLVVVWREAPLFSSRERAALAWTEALTLISETHAPDDVYEELQKHFSEKEIVDLTWAVCAINLWNRVAISFRAVPGHYKPAKAAATSSSS